MDPGLNALLVATSSVPENAEEEIAQGIRYRLDYVELSTLLGVPYVDYGNRPNTSAGMRKIEEWLRLDLFWALALARRVKKEGIDTVFSLSEKIAIPLSFLLGRQINHVVMVHNPMSPRKISLMKRLGIAQRWRKTLVFSRAEGEAVQEALSLSADQVDVVHFPIDTAFYSAAKAKERGGARDFVFSIGLSNRDYPTLLGALSKLPDIPCEISGTSAWVNHKAGYEGHFIPDNVRVVSYDHPNIIRDVYASCRFAVVPINPNASQWSAGAASVLQPQSMGKPVIATRMPGLSDYVNDGVTGILVDGGDRTAMAEAINYLWTHPDRAAEMGRQAQAWAASNFSLDTWTRQVGSLLREANQSTVLVKQPQ